jgi:hypothetical protein
MLVNEHKLIIQAVDAIKKRISLIEASQTVDSHGIMVMVGFLGYMLTGFIMERKKAYCFGRCTKRRWKKAIIKL